MNVLIACEFSGTVRDAFRAAGHEAWSCDLEGVEPEGRWTNYHLYGDVRHFLDRAPGDRPWDLLIGHPPCTYLANSGVRWMFHPEDTRFPYHQRRRHPDHANRWQAMEEAAAFFRQLWNAPIPRIALENPVMHAYARAMVGAGPDQTVQPWQFGGTETKRVCLWLRNLPPLRPTSHPSAGELQAMRQGDGWARVHRMAPGPTRQKERSRFFHGIAATMAAQWGALPRLEPEHAP
jgi:hypothetical protein